MKHTLTATLAAALITLTACGGVEQDSTYDTSNELAEAINTVGEYRCAGMPDDEKVLERDGWAMVSCWNMAGGIYTSDHTRQWLYERNTLEPGERLLEGPNWFMHGDQYLMETVQEHLGGTILED